MATLKSVANGNFTSASSWAIITAFTDQYVSTDSSSFQTTSTSYVVQPTGTAYSSSSQATGILIKLATCPSFSGNLSVQLYLNDGVTIVPNSEVTMNVTSIASPILQSTTVSGFRLGHWIFFKFAAPIALTNGSLYKIGIKSSVNGSVGVAKATAANQWLGGILTSDNVAPAAGDDLIIIGDNLAASPSSNPGTKAASYIITMDNNTNTIFGSNPASSTLHTLWSLYIGDQGTLRYPTTPSTITKLIIKGDIGIGAGGSGYQGTLSIGTVADPIPPSSSAELIIDGDTNAAHKLEQAGGIFSAVGSPRTLNKNISRCQTTTSHMIGDNQLSVNADTGWLTGDEIFITKAVTGSNQTANLASDATSSTITVTPALASNISIDTNIKANLALVTRNVVVRGTSSTIKAYGRIFGGNNVFDGKWTLFKWLTTFTICPTTSQTINFEDCTFQSMNVSTGSGANSAAISYAFAFSTTLINLPSISNCNFISASPTARSSITNNFLQNTLSLVNCLITSNFELYAGLISMQNNTIVDTYMSYNLSTNPSQPIINNNIFIDSICRAGYGSTSTATTIAYRLNVIDNIFYRSILAFDSQNISNVFDQEYDILVNNCKFYSDTNFTKFAAIVCLNNFSTANQSYNGYRSNFYRGYNNLYSKMYLYIKNVSIDNYDIGIHDGNGGRVINIKDVLFSNNNIDVLASRMHVGSIDNHSYIRCYNCTHSNTANKVYVSNVAMSVTTWQTSSNGSAATALIYDASRNSISAEIISDDRVTGQKIIAKDSGSITNEGGELKIKPKFNTSNWPLNYTFITSAIASGTSPTVGLWVRKSDLNQGAEYNGTQPKLVVKTNYKLGINQDTVIATASSANGVWEYLSGTIPVAASDGMIEVYVSTRSATAGWIHIRDAYISTTLDTTSFQYADDFVGLAAYGNNIKNYYGPLIGPNNIID